MEIVGYLWMTQYPLKLALPSFMSRWTCCGFLPCGEDENNNFQEKGSPCDTFLRCFAKCFGMELAPPIWYYEFTTLASNPHTTFVTLFAAKSLALETPLMPTEIGSQICTHLQECWVVISTVSFLPKIIVSGRYESFLHIVPEIQVDHRPCTTKNVESELPRKLRGSIKSKVGFHSPHCRWTHVRLDRPCKLQRAQ